MSAIGRNPQVDFLNLKPLSADPSNPQEGDVFYSDGTSRTEGPWVYQNGSWAQFSTGAAITVVNNLTLTPQSADPGTPTTGMLFYSNGTSRAAGLWAYNGSGWVQLTGVRYQEFTHKQRFAVRAASTVNVVIANQIENGDSFGGVTLATGNLILLKNQTVSSENGVYVVQTSGPAIRSTSFDSADELTYAQIGVTAGTSIGLTFWQTSVLTSLSDAQTWSTTPPTYSFTVPEGVYEIDVLGAGGGGGGGGAAGTDSAAGGAGGGGGGAQPLLLKQKVVPSQVLTVALGLGGVGGDGAGPSVLVAPSGGNGTNSSVSGTDVSLTFLGGVGGGGGANASASAAGNSGVGRPYYSPAGVGGSGARAGGAGGSSFGQGGAGGAVGQNGVAGLVFSGAGGGGAGGSNTGRIGAGGASSIYFSGTSAGGLGSGNQNGGGGGGSSIGIGGAGGSLGGPGGRALDGTGAGGGGGGTNAAGSSVGFNGGTGGSGYIKISW